MEINEEFIKKHWFQLGILAVGIFIAWTTYSALVLQPEKARQVEAADRARAELADTTRKEQAKKDLDSCVADADTKYSNNWYRECKSSGQLTNKCIDVHDLTYQQYLTKYGLTEKEYYAQRGITSTSTFAGLLDYFKRDDECSCRLPLANADRLSASTKDDKDACYKLYPQN
ncbi:MAG: hypothetical protein AAB649_05040 [Patescibacteria group bacterium]